MDLIDDFLPIAVEGTGATTAEGTVVVAEPDEPDPDWHPF